MIEAERSASLTCRIVVQTETLRLMRQGRVKYPHLFVSVLCALAGSRQLAIVGAATNSTDDLRSTTVSFLPACNDTCIAGEQLLGYLYSALYDAELREVHIFADLRHAESMPDDGSQVLDSCVFSNPDGKVVSTVPAKARPMFDNPVYYTGYRVICPSPFEGSSLDPSSTWAGLGLNGTAHAPRIPVTVVPQERRAEVGCCLGTMYGGLELQPQLWEWTRHMEGLQVHHFHVYYTRRNVRFAADTLLSVWKRPESAQPSQMLPGVEWVQVDTFAPDFRWLTGQLTHYQHCMFLHRHVYRYQLFLDSDEIPILRNAAAGLPALLERTFSSYPHAASIAFHRFAFRAGCSPPAAEGTAAAWHQQFNAREKESETPRHIRERGWGHLKDKGDKLAVRPTAVDDFYFHFLRSARPNFSEVAVTLPAAEAFLKHVRRHAGADNCDRLVLDPPLLSGSSRRA